MTLSEFSTEPGWLLCLSDRCVHWLAIWNHDSLSMEVINFLSKLPKAKCFKNNTLRLVVRQSPPSADNQLIMHKIILVGCYAEHECKIITNLFCILLKNIDRINWVCERLVHYRTRAFRTIWFGFLLLPKILSLSNIRLAPPEIIS